MMANSNLTSEHPLSAHRFRLACRMLRNAGLLDVALPGQRSKESLIDYLVRYQVAKSTWHAAEALIAANELTHVLNDLCALDLSDRP